MARVDPIALFGFLILPDHMSVAHSEFTSTESLRHRSKKASEDLRASLASFGAQGFSFGGSIFCQSRRWWQLLRRSLRLRRFSRLESSKSVSFWLRHRLAFFRQHEAKVRNTECHGLAWPILLSTDLLSKTLKHTSLIAVLCLRQGYRVTNPSTWCVVSKTSYWRIVDTFMLE